MTIWSGSLDVAQELGVGGAEHALGELEHQALVVLGHAEDAHDHAQRVGHGDVLGEVALAAEVAELRDVLVGDRVDAALPVLHGRGLEPVVGDLAVAGVLGAVHVDERVRGEAHAVEQLLLELRHQHRVAGVVPDVVTPRHLEHVVVTGQGVERLEHVLFDAVDRVVAPELRRKTVPVVRVRGRRGRQEDGISFIGDLEGEHGGQSVGHHVRTQRPSLSGSTLERPPLPPCELSPSGTIRIRRPAQRRQVIPLQRTRRRRRARRSVRLRDRRPQRGRGQGARRPASTAWPR